MDVSIHPERCLEVALEAARAAARVHLEHVGRVGVEEWSVKGAADFVTHVDHTAESTIAGIIKGAYPSHHIMGEEEVSARPEGLTAGWRDAEWVWLVDPLDGTTNFLHGYPMYSASVAVARQGELLAAAVVCGPSGEEWTAVRGGGAYRNGKRISVSRIGQLRPALIGTGFPFKNIDLMPVYLRQFDAVMRASSGVRRAGSAALDLCHVATGYFDGFWELDLYPWDLAAGALMIREAGGVISALTGPLDLFDRTSVLAGNPAIYSALGIVLRDHTLPMMKA